MRIARIIHRLLQQVSVIGVRRHLGQDDHAHHVLPVAPVRCGGWQRLGGVAGGRQPARGEVDHTRLRAQIAAPSRCVPGWACSVPFGDQRRGIVQPADHGQQVCAGGMPARHEQRRVIRVGQGLKLFEAAQCAGRVPVSCSRGKARVTPAMILASRSPVAAAAAAASSAAARPARVGRTRQVVRQPRQMPCPGDLADAAQLQRAAVLLDRARVVVSVIGVRSRRRISASSSGEPPPRAPRRPILRPRRSGWPG